MVSRDTVTSLCFLSDKKHYTVSSAAVCSFRKTLKVGRQLKVHKMRCKVQHVLSSKRLGVDVHRKD